MKVAAIIAAILTVSLAPIGKAIPAIAMLLAGLAIPPLLVLVSILAPFITGETSFIPMLIL